MKFRSTDVKADDSSIVTREEAGSGAENFTSVPSQPLEAGGMASSPPPRCPDGSSSPRPVSFMWNVAYAEVPGNAGPGTGRGEGMDLRGISGISSQLSGSASCWRRGPRC
jgi:hypothetical protein